MTNQAAAGPDCARELRTRGFGSAIDTPLLPPQVHADLKLCHISWYTLAEEDDEPGPDGLTSSEVVERIRTIAATTTPGPRHCPIHPAVPAIE